MNNDSKKMKIPDDVVASIIISLSKFEFPNPPTTVEDQRFLAQIITNLGAAWKYMIDSNDCDNVAFFKNIQSIVAKDQALELGVFRTSVVYITGTDYIPPLPSEKIINNLFTNFNKANDVYLGAAELLVKLIKTQPFWDGNKRSSFLVVNKLLIERAKGIITIPEKYFDEFNHLLNDYYNDEQALHKLTSFIVKNCIYNTRDKQLVI